MLIGELARRLRVTRRTLRHWEDIGLLAPATVDATTGYRSYGTPELLRGVQIEQLRAAGLSLGDITAVLDGADVTEVLGRRRAELVEQLRRVGRQLAILDSLTAAPDAPRVVAHDATPVDAVTVTATADSLAPTIRRHVQRLRRRHPHATFASRFALDPDDIGSVEIAAFAPGLGTWAPFTALQVETVGPLALLPLAYDALLASADAALAGVVQETYRLGPAPRTTVALLLAPAFVSPHERTVRSCGDTSDRGQRVVLRRRR